MTFHWFKLCSLAKCRCLEIKIKALKISSHSRVANGSVSIKNALAQLCLSNGSVTYGYMETKLQPNQALILATCTTVFKDFHTVTAFCYFVAKVYRKFVEVSRNAEERTRKESREECAKRKRKRRRRVCRQRIFCYFCVSFSFIFTITFGIGLQFLEMHSTLASLLNVKYSWFSNTDKRKIRMSFISRPQKRF